MAISLDTVTSDSILGNTVLTYSHEVRQETVGSGARFLVVAVGANVDTACSVTYNGVAMSQLQFGGVPPVLAGLYSLYDPDLGTHDVVVTLTVSGDIASGARTFHGVRPFPDAIDVSSIGGTTGAADPATHTVTGRSSGEVIVDAVAAAVGSVLVVGADQDEQFQIDLSGTHRVAASTEPGIDGSIVMSWSNAGITNWVVQAVALQPFIPPVEGVSAQFGPRVFVGQQGVVGY